MWNVMFLSKGMTSFKGVRRSMEMKFLQTGSRMKATSTCRMRAAVRAMAGSQVATGGKKVSKIHTRVSRRRLHTEPVSEGCPSVVQVVFQLVVNEAKGEDQEVEKNPDSEKQATATIVDHPDAPFVDESLGLIRPLWGRTSRIRALKGLQTPSLGLVSLEMTWLAGPVGIRFLEVRVLIQTGDPTAV